MPRALVLVEGQTEEQFVKKVLAPHLWTFDVHLDPKIVMTKRVKQGNQFKGGISSFGQVRRDVPKLLGDTSADLVTTMFDLYGIPSDFPGVASVGLRRAHERATYLESALENHFNDPRFCAFLMVHEFEGFAFAQPAETARMLQDASQATALQQERAAFATAEDVDDGQHSHPSQRLTARFPHYRKPLHGPAIMQAIGLTTIRNECPHFAEWLARLEAL